MKRIETDSYQLPVVELLRDPNARVIPLTKGRFALVDAENYELLAENKWLFLNRGYAARVVISKGVRTIVLMHRIVIGTPSDMFTDHKNGNGLDNRKNNLRPCTPSQNVMNSRLRSTNRTGFKSVHFRRGRFEVTIQDGGRRKHLGSFRTRLEAGEAYVVAATKLYGDFFRLR